MVCRRLLQTLMDRVVCLTVGQEAVRGLDGVMRIENELDVTYA